MKLNERGLLVVLSGPSGVGKGTVRKALFAMPEQNFVYSVSMTTRKQRPGEVDGVDYYFVSKEEFEERIKENKFLEYAEFVGNYYGTPLDKVEEQLSLGKEVILREFKLAYKYDYIVVNDEVVNAADRIMAIIRAEHARTERSIHKYMKLIEGN